VTGEEAGRGSGGDKGKTLLEVTRRGDVIGGNISTSRGKDEVTGVSRPSESGMMAFERRPMLKLQ
jgi:hypothetical protein